MKLELLAPAKDASVARQAILHGADAVYIGAPTHGARAAAANSVADIKEVAEFAHGFGTRVYVTFNTIIYEHELADAERLAWELWQAGADALIVQDMALLRMHMPPIALHASTQCDIRSPRKAAFLADCGFSQLVLPRELTLHEITAMRAAVPPDVALEAFVHGALCVSFSGDCQASCVANGRSANRGECAQMCRMAYDLVDGKGNVLMRDKHLLSLRDLCRLDDLEAMAQAGISSFKIEGRLKDEAYVKNAVWQYRQRLDTLIDKYPDRYQRSSWGHPQVNFRPDVTKAFNRGFTSYFFHGVGHKPLSMATFDSPKWTGERVGVVSARDGRAIVADLDMPLHNGDGLGYYDANGAFVGFRVNRVMNNRLFPASKADAPIGTVLYRNRDVERDALLGGVTAKRLIDIDLRLRRASTSLCLEVESEGGCKVEVAVEAPWQAAKLPQAEQRRRVMSKLGDTRFAMHRYDDMLDDMEFVPASVLADLRRQAIEALDSTMRATYRYENRRPENREAVLPCGPALTYHDNVANSLAEEFYRSHGATDIERAIETRKSAVADGTVVMTTRYCLRRELGACLREKCSKTLPQPLYLQNRAARYALRFDCALCQMQLLKA